MKRPFGVTAIAIVEFAIGLYALVVVSLLAADAISGLASGSWQIKESSWPLGLGIRSVEGYVDAVAMLASLGFPLAGIPFGVGMWLLRDWGWRGTIIVQGFHLVTGIVGYFRDTPSYVTWIGAIVIVLYLNQAEVKAAFASSHHVERA